MKYITDSYFTIGSTHKVCQDYVLHSNEDKPYVILSDGCSTADDSDFGSRILCKSLRSLIYNPTYNINSLLDGVIRNAHTISRTMALSDDALCATLIFSRIEDENFKIYAIGDCVLAAKNRNGTITIVEYEFTSGAPYYLRYELGNKKEEYLKIFGDEVYRSSYDIEHKNQPISAINKVKVDFNKIYFEETFPIADWEWVAVMSDGAKSFQQIVTTSTTKQNQSVSSLDTIAEILAYKGYFGEFVQRRSNKAFKQFKEKNIHNYDDFSIGVIACKEEL
jgi:hypothetical protein